MNDLIEELKKEHAKILGILGQVKETGIASAAGRETLVAARDLLLAHMRKEDAAYYPELRKAAAGRPELKVLMDYFLADMEAVSGKALRFFEKFQHGGDEAEFAGGIKLLYLVIKDRILTEEETLFRKFPGKP